VEQVEVLPAGEDTLVKAVEMIGMILVGEEDNFQTSEQIRGMNAFTKQLVMYRSPLHYWRNIGPNFVN